MKSELVKLNTLRKHPDYIRGTIKASYVTELIEAMKDNGYKWIGEPAALQPIPTDHEDAKADGKYWILDGNNRCAASVETNLTEIPAVIYPGLAPEDALALQIRLAVNRGLRLTPAQQTAAIKKMAALNLKQKAIAEKTGLNQASISRILREKQRADGGEKTTEAGGSTATKTPVKFDAENWFKGLARILKGWEKHGSKIRKYGNKMDIPDTCYKSLDTLVDKLLDSEKE